MKKRQRKRVRVFDEEGIALLAERLKELRKEHDFTQEELAYQSGLTLSQIARIETKQANPTVSTIFVIARTLAVPVSELFNFGLKANIK